MNTFLIPFLAFVAVMLIMLVVYLVWIRFFDRGTKAKKQRLQTIQSAVHWSGQNLKSTLQEGALEAWLRARSGTFQQLENLVRRAHSPLTAWRFMAIMLALFTTVLMLGLLRQINILLLCVIDLAISSTPLVWLSLQANRRRQAFEDKLPETLDYISRAMRAGHSLTSAIGMVGKEFSGPVGHEFKTVFDEISFGIPFKEAIGQLSDRVQSNDLNFFVISLMIQHETGGNLTELLDGLSKTMRERVKLRGKIRTVSSEGRASAWVLGSIPFVLAGILTIINPDYISLLWMTPKGQTLMLIASGLMAVGFFLLKNIIQIKV
ncbi:MAG: type II secretion system F family protein [Chlorobiaceae bacterium]